MAYDDGYDNSPLVDFNNINQLAGNLYSTPFINKYEDLNNNFNQKYLESTLTLDAKYHIAEKNRRQKELDLSGYKQGYLVFPDELDGQKVNHDGDSGVIQDAETGLMFQYRGKSWIDYDTADYKKDVIDNPNSRHKYKWQPNIIAQLNNKRISDLTEEDYRNVERYNFLETLKHLEDPNAPFSKYDPSVYYETPRDLAGKKIPILYKAGKPDFYNRLLADVVQPDTGRSVFEDFATNPYMNMKTTLRDSYNTPENIAKFEQHREELKNLQNPIDTLKDLDKQVNDYINNTGAVELVADSLSYHLDLIQSGLYRFWGSMLKEYAPDFMVDKKYWENMAKMNRSGLTGYEEAVGMNPMQRQIYRKLEKERSDTFNAIWENIRTGKAQDPENSPGKWLALAATTLPSTLATSMSQMIPAAAAGSLVGALTGGTGLAAMLAPLSAGLIVNMDNMAQTADEFRENNGRDMTKGEFWNAFIKSFPASALDGVLATTHLGRLFKGTTLGKVLSKTGYRPMIEEKNLGKIILGEMGFETFQEGWENFNQEYFAQDQKNPQSAFDIATSPKVVESALMGGLSGGLMGGLTSSVGNYFQDKQNQRIQAEFNRHQHEIETTNVDDTVASEDQIKTSNAAINASKVYGQDYKRAVHDYGADNMYTSGNTEDDIFYAERSLTIRRLNDFKAVGTTKHSWNEITREQVRIASEILDRVINDPNKTNAEKQEVINETLQYGNIDKNILFGKIVYHSHLNEKNNFYNNVRYDEEEINKERQRLVEIGEMLGIPRYDVNKTLNDVHHELYLGSEGLHAAQENINFYNTLKAEYANKQSLNTEEKEKLKEAEQSALSGYMRYQRMRNINAEKLESIADAFQELADNPTRASVQSDYNSQAGKPNNVARKGKGIYLNRDSLIEQYKHKNGIFNVIDDLFNEVEDMNKFLDTSTDQELVNKALLVEKARPSKYYELRDNSTDIINYMNDVYDSIIDSMDEINSSYEEKRSTRQAFKEADISKYSNLIAKTAQNGKDSRFYNDNINELSSYYNNHKDEWSRIEDNVRSKFYNKNPELDAKLDETLQTIRENAEKASEIHEHSQANITKGINTINNLSTKYTDESLNNLFSTKPTNLSDPIKVEEYFNKLNAARDELRTLDKYKRTTFDNDISTKRDFLNNQLTKVNNQIQSFTQDNLKYVEQKHKDVIKDYTKNYIDNVTYTQNKPEYVFKDNLGNRLAYYDANTKKVNINSNREAWEKAYQDKIWSKPIKFNSDNSASNPLNENLFSGKDGFRQFVDFINERYIQQHNNEKKADETNGQYYDRINKLALQQLGLAPIDVNEDQNNDNNNEVPTSTPTSYTVPNKDFSFFNSDIASKYKDDPDISAIFNETTTNENAKLIREAFDLQDTLLISKLYINGERKIEEEGDYEYNTMIKRLKKSLSSEMNKEGYGIKNNPLATDKFFKVYKEVLQEYLDRLLSLKEGNKPSSRPIGQQQDNNNNNELRNRLINGITSPNISTDQKNAVVDIFLANAEVMANMLNTSVEDYVNSRFEGFQYSTADEFYEKHKDRFPKKPSDKVRGATFISDNGKKIIQMFEKGTVSTAFHESAHFFLDNIYDAIINNYAPDWLKEDLEILKSVYNLKFSALLDANKIAKNESKEWNIFHERFARDFEAYMRKGVAPKPELEGVFAKCKEWITKIYRTVKELLGNHRLSPRTKKVFDDLLTKQTNENNISNNNNNEQNTKQDKFTHEIKTEVVNVKQSNGLYGKTTKWINENTLYVYGGRNGDPNNKWDLGNPFPMENSSEKARKESIAKCWEGDTKASQDFISRVQNFVNDLKQYPKLEKVIFGCFCKPKACHLDNLATYIDGIVKNDLEANKDSNNQPSQSDTSSFKTAESLDQSKIININTIQNYKDYIDTLGKLEKEANNIFPQDTKVKGEIKYPDKKYEVGIISSTAFIQSKEDLKGGIIENGTPGSIIAETIQQNRIFGNEVHEKLNQLEQLAINSEQEFKKGLNLLDSLKPSMNRIRSNLELTQETINDFIGDTKKFYDENLEAFYNLQNRFNIVSKFYNFSEQIPDIKNVYDSLLKKVNNVITNNKIKTKEDAFDTLYNISHLRLLIHTNEEFDINDTKKLDELWEKVIGLNIDNLPSKNNNNENNINDNNDDTNDNDANGNNNNNDNNNIPSSSSSSNQENTPKEDSGAEEDPEKPDYNEPPKDLFDVFERRKDDPDWEQPKSAYETLESKQAKDEYCRKYDIAKLTGLVNSFTDTSISKIFSIKRIEQLQKMLKNVGKQYNKNENSIIQEKVQKLREIYIKLNEQKTKLQEGTIQEKEDTGSSILNGEKHPSLNLVHAENQYYKSVQLSRENVEKLKDHILIIKNRETGNFTEENFIFKKISEATEEDIKNSVWLYQNELVYDYSKAKSEIARDVSEFSNMEVNPDEVGLTGNFHTIEIHGNADPESKKISLLKLVKTVLEDFLSYSKMYIKNQPHSFINSNNTRTDIFDENAPQYKTRQPDGTVKKYSNAAPFMFEKFQSNRFLQLLFDFQLTSTGQFKIGKEGEYKEATDKLKFNDDILSASLYTLMKSLTTNDISKLFDGKIDLEEASNMFGANLKDIDVRDAEVYKNVIDEIGMPQTKYKSDLGKSLLDNLGLFPNKATRSATFYSELCVAAGDFIVELGKNLGLFEFRYFDPDKYKKEHHIKQEDTFPIQNPQWMLRVTERGVVNIPKVKEFFNNSVKDRFEKFNDKENKLFFNEITYKADKPMYVKKTDGMYLVPPRMKRQVEKNSNIEHVLNFNIVNALYEKLPDNLQKQLQKEHNDTEERTYLDMFFDSNFSLLDAALKEIAALDDTISDQGRVQLVERTRENLLEAIRQIQVQAEEKKIAEEQVTFRFPYQIVSNMRYMIATSFNNPQSDKTCRWLMPQKSWYREFQIDKTSKSVERQKFAMAQAFDKLKESKAEVDAIFDLFDNMDEKQLIRAMKDVAEYGENFVNQDTYKYKFMKRKKDGTEVLTEGKLGIENPAQVLHVLAFFRDRARAKAEGKTSFKSYLAVENDATTSGYCIKTLNIPLPNFFDNNLIQNEDYNIYKKLGLLLNLTDDRLRNMSMHELKQLQDFLDIYKTAAKFTYNELEKLFYRVEDEPVAGTNTTIPVKKLIPKEEIEKILQIRLQKSDFNQKLRNSPSSKVAKYTEHAELFMTFEPALPKGTIDPDTGQFKVSAALRLLLKPAVMVFNYTAGLHGIATHLANQLIRTDFVPSYLKYVKEVQDPNKLDNTLLEKHFGDIEKGKAIVNMFNYLDKKKIGKDKDTHISELLKSKSIYNIYIKLDDTNMSVFDAFQSIVEATYGKAAWDGLNTFFEAYRPINDSMNNLGAIQYSNFVDEYEKGMQELAEKYTIKTTTINKKVSGKTVPTKVRTVRIPEIARQKLLNDLKKQFPSIDLEYDPEEHVEGNQVQLLNRERDISDDTLVRSWTVPGSFMEVEDIAKTAKNGKAEFYQGKRLRPEVRRFAAPKKKPAVLAVHSTDGTIMTFTMEDVDELFNPQDEKKRKQAIRDNKLVTYLGVHDAFVSSVEDGDVIPFFANMHTIEINKNWNMYEQLFNKTLDNTIRHFTDKNKEGKSLLNDFLSLESTKQILQKHNTEFNNVESFIEQNSIHAKYEFIDSYLKYLRDNFLQKVFPDVKNALVKFKRAIAANNINENQIQLIGSRYKLDTMISRLYDEYNNKLKDSTENHKVETVQALTKAYNQLEKDLSLYNNYPLNVYTYSEKDNHNNETLSLYNGQKVYTNYYGIYGNKPGEYTTYKQTNRYTGEVTNKVVAKNRTDLIRDLQTSYNYLYKEISFMSEGNLADNQEADVKTLPKIVNGQNIGGGINAYRNYLYSQNIFGANIDSNSSKGVYHYFAGQNSALGSILEDNKRKQHIIDFIERTMGINIPRFAHAGGFTPSATRRYLLSRTNTDPEARIELLQQVNELSKSENLPYLSDEEMENLNNLLRLIPTKALSELAVSIEDYAFNTGEYNPLTKEINLAKDKKDIHDPDLDPNKGYSAKSNKSLAEVLAHEYLHAGLQFANEHKNEFGVKPYFDKLRQIQRYLFEHNIITEDMFKDTTLANQNLASQIAKDTIKHMWGDKNANILNDEALNETIVECLTNPKIIEVLKQKDSFLNNSKTFFENLKDLVIAIFKAVFMKGNFKDIATNFNNMINGVKFKQSRTLYADIHNLVDSLLATDKKLDKRLSRHPLATIEPVWNSIEKTRNFLNQYTIPMLHQITHFIEPVKIRNDLTNLEKWKNRVFYNIVDENSKLYKIFTNKSLKLSMWMLANIFVAPLSPTSRRAIHILLTRTKMFANEGFIRTVWRDVNEQDLDTSFFEMLALYKGQVDVAAKGIEAGIKKNLDEYFTEEDKTDDKQEALTRVALGADLQCLMGSLVPDVQALKKFISDDAEIQKHIDSFKNDLRTAIITRRNNTKQVEAYNFIQNQAKALGYYLATGLGNEVLNLNANNIAALNYLEEEFLDYKVDKNPDLVKKIDMLATLYAVQELKKNNLGTVNDFLAISDKGLNNFIESHKTFVYESNEGFTYRDVITGKILEKNLFEPIENGFNDTCISNMQKGYYKRIYDPNIEAKFAPSDPATEKKMIEQGYTTSVDIRPNKATKKRVKLYTRKSYNDEEHRDGTAYVMLGSHRIGTSLEEAAEALDSSEEILNINAWTGLIHNAKIMRKQSDENKCNELIQKITNHAVPSPRQNQFDYKDQTFYSMPVAYRYTGSFELHKDYLGINTNATDILSRMYASSNIKAQSFHVNQVLIKALVSYQNQYMDSSTLMLKVPKKNKLYGTKFVELKEDTDNEFLAKAWKSIPRQFKEYTKNVSPIYIREDWLLQLCGVPNFTLGGYIGKKLTDMNLVNENKAYTVKKFTGIIELIGKFLAAQTKKMIVIGKPIVLLGNVASNFVFSLMKFNNPIKLLSLQIQNFKNTVTYMDDRKEYNRLMYQMRKNKAKGVSSDKIENSMLWLKTKMKNNPVSTLIEAGMVQNIVEGVRDTDLDKAGRPYKILKKFGITDVVDKLPKTIKLTGGWLWRNGILANNSEIYKLLYTLVQYSDFIARATEYQLAMEPNHQRTIINPDNGKVTYEKIPSKYNPDGTLNNDWVNYEKEVKIQVLNNFINYDRPQSQVEQYLNDIGLFMFTKFFKSIQPVILNTLKYNPIGALAMIATQTFLVNTDDIYEQNVFSKNWSSLVHSPVDNFLMSIIPWGGQIAMGDTDLLPSPFKPL